MNSEIHRNTMKVNCSVGCNCAKIVQTQSLLVVKYDPDSKDSCFCGVRSIQIGGQSNFVPFGLVVPLYRSNVVQQAQLKTSR